MQAAVQRVPTTSSGWHLGDLPWMRFQHVGREPEWPTALWTGPDDTVVAFGWAELPGHLELFVDPDHALICAAVLDWFDDVAQSDRRTVTTVDTCHHVTTALAAAGYRPDDAAHFTRLGSLDLATLTAPVASPPGFSVRPVTDADRAERVLVHRAAFAPSRVTPTSYRIVQSAWPYRTELDWVVQTPDGGFASFALVWFDEHNRVGELEPVGCAPQYRRRGLARAVCVAALHALRDVGGEQAVVSWRGDGAHPGPEQLYTGLGFRPHLRTVTFVNR